MTRPRRRDDRGQATIEMIGIIPIAAMIAGAIIQLYLVGYAAVAAESASRLAAREASKGMSSAEAEQVGAQSLGVDDRIIAASCLGATVNFLGVAVPPRPTPGSPERAPGLGVPVPLERVHRVAVPEEHGGHDAHPASPVVPGIAIITPPLPAPPVPAPSTAPTPRCQSSGTSTSPPPTTATGTATSTTSPPRFPS